MMKQVLTILGATGSIGCSTLDVIARHSERFEVFALTGHSQIAKLAEQCVQFQPRFVVVANEDLATELRAKLQAVSCATEVLFGEQALIEVASASEVTGVMAAIVGAAGLPPTLAAAQSGKTIYLANKETLVVAGELFMCVAQQSGAKILPIDSEHNAIFQVLPADFQAGKLAEHGINSLILTASGGPFLHTDLAILPNITPEQAVKHPNWSMGQKISVDSASMMNKGLELIEAHHLFGAKPNELEVVIHSQSVIHSMVRYRDGSVLAQMGKPDMRTPIAYCLGLPERLDSGVGALDFTTLGQLDFCPVDFERFPCLKLAYQAMEAGGVATCVLNAANEEAVAAFLAKQIRFTDIARVVEHALNAECLPSADSIADLLEQDKQTRLLAQTEIQRLSV
ncbi:MAG: 1-deoxy-D-xylulose-5-phosphate reductoisomerase [Neisseria sp.]|nr:1-deoxy-D-xylulose-5-phosphate reductoisomerase [Neisseria sp.]